MHNKQQANNKYQQIPYTSISSKDSKATTNKNSSTFNQRYHTTFNLLLGLQSLPSCLFYRFSLEARGNRGKFHLINFLVSP